VAVFKIWPYKNFKNMFLEPISAVCDAIYQGMFSLLFIIPQCQIWFNFVFLSCSDITTNLNSHNLSTTDVEDWKVIIPSYDIFPTVPLTFDEAYWKAYWPIVNEPVLNVREVMVNVDKERREIEMKKISENMRKLESEESERLEEQKKARVAKTEEEENNS
jgi:hypothetical protein